MADLFSSFLTEIVNSCVETLDDVLVVLLDSMLWAERFLSGVVSGFTGRGGGEVYSFVTSCAYSLIILKFLFKGFQIYILWRDGDADSSPQDMLIGSAEAVIMMLAFPTLYNVMADVTKWFSSGIMRGMGLSDTQRFPQLSGATTSNIIFPLFMIVYLVLVVVLCVKLIQRGFELLILRLGVPIACIGLIDSDLGLFKGYMQTFFKTLFTSVLQITLMSLSLRVAFGMLLPDIIIALALVSTALGTPVLLQQFLVATGRGGGGLTNKIYTASMAARAFSMFKKGG